MSSFGFWTQLLLEEGPTWLAAYAEGCVLALLLAWVVSRKRYQRAQRIERACRTLCFISLGAGVLGVALMLLEAHLSYVLMEEAFDGPAIWAAGVRHAECSLVTGALVAAPAFAVSRFARRRDHRFTTSN